MADGSKLLVLRDPGDLVEEDRLSAMLLNFFSGSFVEKISTAVTSDGVTVTFTLQNSDLTNDLTMRFSDGFTVLDVTPAIEFELDAGTLASPTENYVYIPISTKVLTKDNSDWPAGEHIKVAFLYIPGAVDVQADDGGLIHQPWNDGSADTGENGHMLDLAERLRIGGGADWYSGVSGTGADNYLTITPGSPDTVTVQSGAGVVYQLHRHVFPAQDTSSGDNIHIVNHDTTPNVGLADLADLDNDASGGSLTNKHFNVVLWGVANATATHSPLMLNLPTGTYNNQAAAEEDASNFTVFDIPEQYFTFSSTGFLICRMLLRKQSAGGGTWTLVETEDLRGSKPGVLAGAGAGGGAVEFADNTFRIFDETSGDKLSFELSGLSADRTVTALDTDGIFALTDAILTVESIPFVDASGRLDEDTAFVRDAATGNVGINQSNPGAKLDVGGQVKITGGAPGAGKVLTDVAGTGLATWEAPSGGGGGGGWTDDGATVRLTTAADNVGVGTATPDGKLHVHTASAGGVTANVSADDVVVENSANAGISVLVPTANTASFFFGSPADSISSFWQWTGTTNVTHFGAHKSGGELWLYHGAASIGAKLVASGNLELTNQILIAGGTPGAGKVLTDVGGTGLATWEAATGGTPSGWTDDGAVVRTTTPGDKVGIGTSTPGSPGTALFEIAGTTASESSGPHVQIVGSSAVHPMWSMLNWSVDDVTMMFGAYYDASAFKSSSSTANFAIRKNSGKLNFLYDSGVAAGSSLAWNTGLALDTAGYVGIGTSSPSVPLNVVTPDGTITRLESSHATLATLQIRNLSSAAGTVAAPGFAFAVTGTDSVTKSAARCTGRASNEWTSTASTRSGFMRFETRKADTMSPHLWLTENGDVGIETAAPDGSLHVDGQSDQVHGIFEAHSTQTSDVLQIRNSSGTVVVSIDASGNISIPAGSQVNFEGSAGDSWIKYDTGLSTLRKSVDGTESNL